MLKFPFVCPVAGISNYQHAASRVRVGDRILVEPDLANPYDPFAVAFKLADGNLIGYVPKTLAARLSKDGTAHQLVGVVAEVFDGHDTIGLRVRVDRAGVGQVSGSFDGEKGEMCGGSQTVHARGTRRPLGTLVRVDEQKRRVFVLAGNGSTVSYPAGLVDMTGPDLDGTVRN